MSDKQDLGEGVVLDWEEKGCFDLRAYAKSHHLRWEFESGPKPSPEEESGCVEIPCTRGKIYPFGGEILLALVRTPHVWKTLLTLKGVAARRGGFQSAPARWSGEGEVAFKVDSLAAVLGVLKPRKRRQGGGGNPEALKAHREAQKRKAQEGVSGVNSHATENLG